MKREQAEADVRALREVFARTLSLAAGGPVEGLSAEQERPDDWMPTVWVAPERFGRDEKGWAGKINDAAAAVTARPVRIQFGC